jgi:DNA-directed RNA polymerase specialized sigma24 family protein
MNARPQTDQFSLFDMPPVAPGYADGGVGSKERGGASEEAARKIAPAVNALRAAVMAKFIEAGEGGLTADECAARLGRDELSIRPRCSELVASRKIIKTLARRPTRRGMTATVMKVWPPSGGESS